MIVTIVHIKVTPAHINDFIEATKINHSHSIKEHGNKRFDFLQDKEDPTKFILYEAYHTQEQAAKHKETEHYLTWRKTVEPWMAEKRAGIPYSAIKPE